MRSAAFILCAAVGMAAAAQADTFVFTDPSGLAAEAEFTLIDDFTLEVRLRNTSTGVPGGFDSSDQLLTSISWDFGLAGDNPGDATILDGSVVIGPFSHSMNFDTGDYFAGDDVSGEYGYGNTGTTGLLPNFFSTNQSHTTIFGGVNLDGPAVLSGPQGGLIADPMLVDLGGLGAIQNEIVATLTLSDAVTSLSFLHDNDMIVEFGSDAAFIPAPSSVMLLGASALVWRRRR